MFLKEKKKKVIMEYYNLIHSHQHDFFFGYISLKCVDISLATNLPWFWCIILIWAALIATSGCASLCEHQNYGVMGGDAWGWDASYVCMFCTGIHTPALSAYHNKNNHFPHILNHCPPLFLAMFLKYIY